MKKTYLATLALLLLAACSGNQSKNTDSSQATDPVKTETEAPAAQEKDGMTAPDFSGTTPDGATVSLAQVCESNKYVLVDFWASWCGPCRGEIPNLKKAYDRFHDKGFEILSVSLDHGREPWINTVDKMQMKWPNIWDENGQIADMYGVSAIPAMFLLDHEGKLVAVDLRGEALEQKLTALFN